jgi:hypothetical protein
LFFQINKSSKITVTNENKLCASGKVITKRFAPRQWRHFDDWVLLFNQHFVYLASITAIAVIVAANIIGKFVPWKLCKWK